MINDDVPCYFPLRKVEQFTVTGSLGCHRHQASVFILPIILSWAIQRQQKYRIRLYEPRAEPDGSSGLDQYPLVN